MSCINTYCTLTREGFFHRGGSVFAVLTEGQSPFCRLLHVRKENYGLYLILVTAIELSGHIKGNVNVRLRRVLIGRVRIRVRIGHQ